MSLGIKKHSLLLLVLCNILCIAFTDSIHFKRESSSCVTPGRQRGSCIIIHKCQPIVQLALQKGISNPPVLSFLRRSTCGFIGKNPMVCCPSVPKSPSSALNFNRYSNSPKSIPSQQNQYEVSSVLRHPLLPSNCGPELLSNRIIGGEETDPLEFPWMALIEYSERSRGSFTACGGTLISHRYVLTAAHCVVLIPSTWKLLGVHLGVHDMRKIGQCSSKKSDDCRSVAVPIEQTIVHSKFMEARLYSNDIALLRLVRKVEFSAYIQPICLPNRKAPHGSYWTAGWGQTKHSAASNVKDKVSVAYYNFEKCSKLFKSKNVVLGAGQMCAGGEFGKDSCKGDSGGPLMNTINNDEFSAKWVVDGVVSLGNWPCGQKGWPAVYTNVYHYRSWITHGLRP